MSPSSEEDVATDGRRRPASRARLLGGAPGIRPAANVRGSPRHEFAPPWKPHVARGMSEDPAATRTASRSRLDRSVCRATVKGARSAALKEHPSARTSPLVKVHVRPLAESGEAPAADQLRTDVRRLLSPSSCHSERDSEADDERPEQSQRSELGSTDRGGARERSHRYDSRKEAGSLDT
jgi:hypothetical protein